MKYVRIYGNIILVVLLAALGVVLAPTVVSAIVGYLPGAMPREVEAHSPLITAIIRIAIMGLAGMVVRILVRERRGALHEWALGETHGEIELYRSFVGDVGVEPSLTRQVIELNSQLREIDRVGDFHRANQPNFAAELGYQLGVNSDTRRMMQEFFAGADPEARRSFSTSTHVTIEGGRIEQTYDTAAQVEPVSRYAPKDPGNDPNWRGEVTPVELHAKIFGKWDDSFASVLPTEDVDATSGNSDVIERRGGWDIDDFDFELAVLRTSIADVPVGHQEPFDLVAETVKGDAGSSVGESVLEADEPEHADMSADATETGVEEDAGEVFELPVYEDADIDGGEEDDRGVLSEDEFENEAERVIGAQDVFSDDDEIFAQVEGDPVISGLIKAIGLTRRLPKPDKLRYLFAFYGSEVETLVGEFNEPSITHIEQIGSRVEPLYRYAGIQRHQAAAWVIELSGTSEREDDLSAIVWIPVGIAPLGDTRDRRAWKLFPVPSGSSATFFVLRSQAPLIAARLEWILGNLYEDLQIEKGDKTVQYFLPSLGVVIDLVATGELSHGDNDIHGDDDPVGGPTRHIPHNVSLLGDGAREWLSDQLGTQQVGITDWLGLVHMMTTLLMHVEPVTSKELLGQWATAESSRGKELIAMLHTVFGDSFTGCDDGWLLSNVRLDLFWLEELLAEADDEVSRATLADFFTRKFHPEILQWLPNLGAMDPRMRSGDAVRLEKLVRQVLTGATTLLSPSATGVLLEHLEAISSVMGKG